MNRAEIALADDDTETTPRRRIRLPLSHAILAILVAAFLLPGVVGRDPWKFDDAFGIGIAWGTTQAGWLVPHLAGRPFLDHGPLFYWVAGALGSALSFVLPFHDGARLASMLFVLVALWFVRLAARELHGEPQGQLSMLALIGCLGLFVHAHEATAETAMLAGSAATYYGLAIAWKKPVKAAAFFAVGATIAFLSRGVFAVAPLIIASVLLLPFAAAHRAKSYAQALALGLALFLALASLWPAALAIYAPDVLPAWFARQIALVTQPATWAKVVYHLKTLTWAAWPVWPLAIWAVWAYRRYLRDPGFAVPVVATIVTLVLLVFSPSDRNIDMLALLVPLAIPAGAAAISLRRGAAEALASFSVVMFGLIAGALWVMWLAWHTGVPATMANNVAKHVPGLTPDADALRMLAGLGLTAAWMAYVLFAERSPLRAITHWAAGVAFCWALVAVLWTPWVNYTQSYAALGAELRRALPLNAGCVSSRGLSDVTQGLLHYHAGLITERRENGRGDGCKWLLIAGRIDERRAPGAAWKLVWEGSRPRDRERLTLYRRS
jgi:4-amino-4-deoxy-L-arabinose transferase-like glycosyltransferase